MPHIRILAQVVLKYRVDKVFIIAIMAESKKRHNLVNILQNSLKRPNLYAKYQNATLNSLVDFEP